MDLIKLDKGKTRRKSGSLELGTMMYGKVPPQAKKIEENLLGRIINEQSIFDMVTELIKTKSFFYMEAHQRIFEAMLVMREKSIYIDLCTIVEQLKKNEELDLVGGPYYITKISSEALIFFDVDLYCKIIAEKFILRELIRISGEIIQDAYEDSTEVFELLDRSEKDLLSISFKNFQHDYVNAGGSDIINVLNRIEMLRNRVEDVTGVPTGFKEVNRVTSGWQSPDLIILAARPSMGKTAFALNLARNAAKEKGPVAFFSLEMSLAQCQNRLLSAESGIGLEKLLRGKMDDEEMIRLKDYGVNPLSKLKILIDDTPALGIFELRNKCRRLKYKENVCLIIVDYIQLMSGIKNFKENREQEISKITRDLKGLAKELNVPIIALSQLSRDLEKRKEGNKMPQLSDLRESGAIEQDADVVMFMYRPEYYGINVNESGDNNNGETIIRFAKHRNGTTENIKIKANLWKQKFEDLPEAVKRNGNNPNDFAKVNGFVPIVGSKMNGDDNDEWDFTKDL